MKCRLKEILLTEFNDMHQTELAKALNMSDGHLSQIATGKIIPSLKTAIRIAKYLGKHVEDIWKITP